LGNQAAQPITPHEMHAIHIRNQYAIVPRDSRYEPLPTVRADSPGGANDSRRAR
jgi:hypothetical protein